MRIGILTHPIETNYGGILQAYALQKTLFDLGHDVITIDRHQKPEYSSFIRHLFGYAKRLTYYYLFRQNFSTYWDPNLTEEQYRYITHNIQSFIDKNIRLTDRILNSQLPEIEKYNFDAYVVGSDQVWLPDFCPNSFLDFVKRKDVIKIFYAASTGKDCWANYENLKQRCRKLAQSFKAISVREKNLIEISKKELGIDAQWVLDPTMLICKEEYQHNFNLKKDKNDILFSYILDPDSSKQYTINSLSKDMGLSHIEGNVSKYCFYRNHHLNLDDYLYPSVESWLEGFYKADFVITDSFHGTVFSIIFNKQFVIIGNEKRGMERFISLLKKFGLESRLAYSAQQAESIAKETIDFNDINSKLKQFRDNSISFLKNNLKA